MKKLKKISIWILSISASIYLIICGYMYFAQESLIFHPDQLSKTTTISYGAKTEELMIKTADGINLSCVISKTDSIYKGLVFFLHGNAGNLTDQKEAANFYNQLGYDFFTMDYRGFGKSEGEITSEEQFFEDIETAYDHASKGYSKKEIIVIGYSVGTASAAMIASRKNPAGLVLIAPYYSLIDMTNRNYPYIPSFLLKYRFETNEFVKKTKSPIFLVHGDKDDILPFEGSKMLTRFLKKKDRFVPIQGQDHNNFEESIVYRSNLINFLSACQQ